MGLSSSQARLLSLTGRMHDIEYKAQRLEAQKLQMANDSAHVYKEYENALNATKIQLKTIGADGSATYIDATYNNMLASGYQIKFQERVKVSQGTADNFTDAAGNKDYFVYLETGVSGAPPGYTAIYTADDLKNIGSTGNYMLMADIDLGGAEWTPIGTSANKFSGTFDGNGHTISNFTVNSSTNGAGLFGYAENATITNTIVANADIHTDGNTSGALVSAAINSNISNCIAQNVTVSATNYAGGLVGYVSGTAITNSSSSGNISGTYGVGGLLGIVRDSSSVANCTTSANVIGENNVIGGFTGYVQESSIDKCSATGSVTGHREVGGFVGQIYRDGTVTNSSASGNVTGVKEEPFDPLNADAWNYGGFAGGNIGTIDYCSASGDVFGWGNLGGFLGHNEVVDGSTYIGSVSNSYCTGKVTMDVGGNDAGGFTGDNKPTSTSTNCYFNSAASGMAVGIGNNEDGTQNVADVSLNEIANKAAAGDIGPSGNTISVTPPSVNYKNNSPEAKEAETLFDSMQYSGYEVVGGPIVNPSDGHEDDNSWFTNMLLEGFLFLFKQGSDGEYYQTNLATDTNLQEVRSDIELKKAEAKYESDMRKIDAKDKKFDTDLAALEAERNAIKTEMETLKTVAKDNVDRTFKLFS